jgi:hypothetical protein
MHKLDKIIKGTLVMASVAIFLFAVMTAETQFALTVITALLCLNVYLQYQNDEQITLEFIEVREDIDELKDSLVAVFEASQFMTDDEKKRTVMQGYYRYKMENRRNYSQKLGDAFLEEIRKKES